MNRKLQASITFLLLTVCFSCINEKKQNQAADTLVADSTTIEPLQEKNQLSDSPAVGTDNIRMDSMNNSSR